MTNIIPFPSVSRSYYDAHTGLVEALIGATEEAHETGVLRCASALRVHEAMRVYFERARVELGDAVLARA